MRYTNQLEPEALIRSFLAEPPEGFSTVDMAIGDTAIPGFFLKFNLLTTLDEPIKKRLGFLERLLPRPLTLFVGTTVSEYCLFPPGADAGAISAAILGAAERTNASICIIKDLPLDSPLLSADENSFSRILIDHLRTRFSMIISGEALAYVPITFRSIEEYLQRFSHARRKNFKRKLKSRPHLDIACERTGSDFFNPRMVADLYRLYQNVFQESDVHFDRLSPAFFRALFTDVSTNGLVFIYRHQGIIIGWNLCFVENGNLVDKYVGFCYPEAREHNLYFVSWFYNLDYCIEHNLRNFIAGWSDAAIKAQLGAQFTYTYHAVNIKNPVLRFLLRRIKFLFESDRRVLERMA